MIISALYFIAAVGFCIAAFLNQEQRAENLAIAAFFFVCSDLEEIKEKLK
jgi:uncharacterized membrane protein